MLCGVFNSHDGMWGGRLSNSDARSLVIIMGKNDYVALNILYHQRTFVWLGIACGTSSI